MQARYIPAIVMLIAGALTCIITAIKHYDVVYSLELLLAVLLIFYVIGLIAKHIILKTIQNSPVTKEENTDESEEEGEQEEKEKAEE